MSRPMLRTRSFSVRVTVRIGTAIAALFVATFLTSPTGFAQGIGELVDRLEFPTLFPERRGDDARERDSEEEPLETDRDSFTPATTTVGKGRFLAETSYSFIDNRDADDTHSFPEMITRFGLTDRVEFRIGWNYEVGGGGGAVSGGELGSELEEGEVERESQLLTGFKFALTKQDGWIPQSACIVQTNIPTSGPDTFSDFQLGHVFGWTVLNDWRIDSSIRYISTKERADHFNQWAPSVVLKVPVRERWNVHGEYFGIITSGRSDNTNAQYFSPGIHYLINKNCEIGVRVGWGLNHDAANFFTNVGLGVRF